MFDKRGIEIIGMFDINPVLVNQKIEHVDVYSLDSLDEFCKNNRVDFAVLTLPKENAQEVASRLVGLGVKGFWNFTGQELDLSEDSVVENVHLGDSLMTLCYRIAAEDGE